MNYPDRKRETVDMLSLAVAKAKVQRFDTFCKVMFWNYKKQMEKGHKYSFRNSFAGRSINGMKFCIGCDMKT